MKQTNDFWSGFKTAMKVFNIATTKSRDEGQGQQQEITSSHSTHRKLFEDYLDIPTFIRRGRDLQHQV